MILCIGTTPAVQRIMEFSRVSRGTTNRATDTHITSAGKSVNVAKVVSDLGEAACAITFLGGASGELIRDDLQRRGIALDAIHIARPTRTCTTVIEHDDAHVTELIEETPPVTADELAALWQRCQALIPRAAMLVLSGSLAPGVPATFYADCLRLARQHGIRAIVDAQGEPLQHALAECPFVIKPNRAELAATTGLDVDTPHATRAAMRKLTDRGAGWVIVTTGESEVLIGGEGRCWMIHPPTIRALNPIGSGDSFAGGLAVALARHQPMPDAVVLAVACGTANALNLFPGQVKQEDVARFVRQMRIEVA